MSLTSEWTDWHLTRRGWIAGNVTPDMGPEIFRDPPEDRVATFQYHGYQSCSFAKMYREVQEIWNCGDTQLVARLIKRFGKCPEVTGEPLDIPRQSPLRSTPDERQIK